MTNIYLLEVPDYTWYGGCFGTASANLMGYWDRHGLPDFYTGPTAGGVAPLDSCGVNFGIRSIATTRAGLDGRSTTNFGHIDDYWASYSPQPDCYSASFSYESTAPDPYLVAGRPEHTPDCIGDFIGLSQRKWTNMNNECDGNIDAYSFVYWDLTGNRRTNFVPTSAAGTPARDIQSGLREWTRWRGYDADVFTQLTDFNPNTPSGHGFTFNHMKAEIDAGYPVLLFLQPFNEFSRSMTTRQPPMSRANPDIHGMLAYGYYIEGNNKYVHYRTSWGDSSGLDTKVALWSSGPWEAGLPVRGVILYHPKPKITTFTRTNNDVIFHWEGPQADLYDEQTGTSKVVHRYVVERSFSMTQPFVPVTSPTTDHFATVTNCCGTTVFFRVRLLTP